MVNGTVPVSELAEKMGLSNLTPDIDLTARSIEFYDVNRPALQLTGFFDHFDDSRVQIIGYVEQEYIDGMDDELARMRFEKLLSYNIPCLVFSRSYQPADYVLSICAERGIPCLVSQKTTSDLSSEMVRWLKVKLAPCISIHGVLVDVYGEGVLIMGDSGVGKSEAALELVKRGHRLVTDDVVEIRKVSDDTLIGSAPEVTKNFIELRGIGIINDQETFLRLWAAYNTTDTTALPPSIDFENFVVLFIYDPEYYNRIFIRGLNVWEGIANPIVERTNWKLSIGGDPKMREIREKQGLSVPEPKVNVGLLELLRNKPGRPGVTAVLVEGAEDPAESLVIPVPEAP